MSEDFLAATKKYDFNALRSIRQYQKENERKFNELVKYIPKFNLIIYSLEDLPKNTDNMVKAFEEKPLSELNSCLSNYFASLSTSWSYIISLYAGDTDM